MKPKTSDNLSTSIFQIHKMSFPAKILTLKYILIEAVQEVSTEPSARENSVRFLNTHPYPLT